LGKKNKNMKPPLATVQEVVAALKELGYKPQIQGNLVALDINPEPGIVRSYSIEVVNDSWSINQKVVIFKHGQDEEEEDESELGSFRSAMEVACAIDKEEDV
jgi:hypothetical protein